MRGVVVDIKDERAVILADNGTFIDVKNKKYKIGQKVSTSSGSVIKFLKIAACIALCLITSTLSYKFYYTPYSYVYIDINPSVRLDINYFDIVIDCVPLNEDAEFIEVSSGNIEESVSEVISKCEEKGFLNEKNNEIEINVSDDEICAHIADAKEKHSNKNYNLTVKQTTTEETEAANKYGMSVKRHRAINDFTQKYGGDNETNIEKLQDKTTKEIYIIVSEEQNETTVQKPESDVKNSEDNTTSADITNKKPTVTAGSNAVKADPPKAQTKPKQPEYNKQNNAPVTNATKPDEKKENTNSALNDKPLDDKAEAPVDTDNQQNVPDANFQNDKKDDGAVNPPEITPDREHEEEVLPEEEPSTNHGAEKPNKENFAPPEEEGSDEMEPPAVEPPAQQPGGNEQGKEEHAVPDAPKPNSAPDAPAHGETSQVLPNITNKGGREI